MLWSPSFCFFGRTGLALAFFPVVQQSHGRGASQLRAPHVCSQCAKEGNVKQETNGQNLDGLGRVSEDERKSCIRYVDLFSICFQPHRSKAFCIVLRGSVLLSSFFFLHFYVFVGILEFERLSQSPHSESGPFSLAYSCPILFLSLLFSSVASIWSPCGLQGASGAGAAKLCTWQQPVACCCRTWSLPSLQLGNENNRETVWNRLSRLNLKRSYNEIKRILNDERE